MSVEAIARIAGKGLALDHIPGGIPKLSMEELMGAQDVVCVRWRNDRLLQLLTSSGTFVSVVIEAHVAHMSRVVIDRALVGKLHADSVCNVVVADTFVLFSYDGRPSLGVLSLSKKKNPAAMSSVPADARKLSKFSSSDVRHAFYALPRGALARVGVCRICTLLSGSVSFCVLALLRFAIGC